MNQSTLFINLQVIDPASQLGGATAILTDDGKIIAIGDTAEVQAHPAAQGADIVDLGQRFVVPGFIDPHAHPLMYGQMMDWVDVGPSKAQDIPEIIKILKLVDAQMPAGLPLRAFGYEHRNLAEGRHPNRWEIDQISTTREIYIMNASGHGGVVNSIVLESNNIDRSTKDPAAGRFERNEDNEPTGVLWDAACDILTGADGVKLKDHGPNFHLPDSLETLTKQLIQAEVDFASHGTTTIGDAQVSRREYDVYKFAQEKQLLNCRYTFYLTSALLAESEELRSTPFLDGQFLIANGIKLYADGTLGGWTAYFPEGYAVDKERKGQLYHTSEDYERLFLEAGEKGFHIATHAQSPTAIGMVIAATKKLRELGYKTYDGREIVVRIEHCGLPSSAQSAELAELGIVAVAQPLHHHNWGDGVVTAVGEAMGGRFNPLGEFVRSGTKFALSSDAPVAKPRPFETMAAAIDRRTVHGNQMGDQNLAINLTKALFAHTMGGAIALGREDSIGSLEVGKFADFVVLEVDPFSLDIEALRSLEVSETWINSRRIY